MSNPPEPDLSTLRVDGTRLWERLEALGEIGAVLGPNGERGVARLALSDEDRAGRDLVVAWMQDLGMSVSIDGIGNVVATRSGRDPSLAPVMTGSHIDTVRTGGRFDGNLGVLAGLEVVETLAAHGITPDRAIQVAFFTDEEGARVPPDMLGSLVYVGGLGLESALDARAADGARLGDELNRIGYAGATPCPAASFPAAYVELHIEQGPVLDAEGITIGAVENLQGISWQELTLTGQSNHAGTTPMRLRHDAGYAAAAIGHFLRGLTNEMGGNQVATVGALTLHPNLINVIPARAVMTVDLRNTDETMLQQAEQALNAFLATLAKEEGVTITSRRLARFEPVVFDAGVAALIARQAQALGHSCRPMTSGAGHDAQMLARLCPTAMVFVPSVKGISHNPAEHTAPEHLAAGADVLLRTLVALGA